MHSFLGVPILIRGQAYGNLYLTEKEGGEFDEGDEEALVVLADWAAIAIENARLYRDVRRRRDELERTVTALETTTAIARAVGGETDLERILELIVKRGRALVDARAMVIELREGDELVIQAAARRARRDVVGRAHRRRGLAGAARSCRSRQRRAPRRRPGAAALRAGRARRRARPVCSCRSCSATRRWASSAAFDRVTGGPEFSAEDERLMQAFAASAATAVATAQTVAAAGAASAASRPPSSSARAGRASCTTRRLQELAALQAASRRAQRARSPRTCRDAVAQAVEHVDASIQAMRSLITDMRPASLDELGVGTGAGGARRALVGAVGRRRQARRRPRATRRGRQTTRLAPVDRDDDLPRRPGGADERRQARRGARGPRVDRRRARRRRRDRGAPTTAAASPVTSPATASGSSACASAYASRRAARRGVEPRRRAPLCMP